MKDKQDSPDAEIRVLIADDHPVVRVGIVSMLKSIDDMLVVCEAASVDETLRGVQSLKPDVTVLDVMMGDCTGIESVQRVREAAPDAKIVVYTGLTELEVAMQALELGVREPHQSPQGLAGGGRDDGLPLC